MTEDQRAPTIFQDDLFEGEVVAITGGGTGIGLAIAREVARLGAKVAICGRRPEPLADAAKLIARESQESQESQEGQERAGQSPDQSQVDDRVFAEPCDIRDPEQVAAWVRGVLDRFGRIDVLVNNAGGQFPSPAESISPKGFEAVVRNNLLGTWNFTHAVGTMALIPQKRGRIINIIAQCRRGFPGMVHTGAARAGVENLTMTLAVEWAMHGIRVNAVAPGIIESTGTKQYPPSLLENARKACLAKRLGQPEEVSHLVCYLASPQADFITGQTFSIDGGQSLWGDQWLVDDDVPTFAPYESPEGEPAD
ncbi:MAG: SDR family oxidoreductase [Deltaproteobacteria bacterium]|nr:SDR family oxidoreductase [Deltaproteobacteria bacterium]